MKESTMEKLAQVVYERRKADRELSCEEIMKTLRRRAAQKALIPEAEWRKTGH